jgi:hypothetical protein
VTGHGRAGFGERYRNGRAEAAGSSRDQRDFSIETKAIQNSHAIFKCGTPYLYANRPEDF